MLSCKFSQPRTATATSFHRSLAPLLTIVKAGELVSTATAYPSSPTFCFPRFTASKSFARSYHSYHSYPSIGKSATCALQPFRLSSSTTSIQRRYFTPLSRFPCSSLFHLRGHCHCFCDTQHRLPGDPDDASLGPDPTAAAPAISHALRTHYTTHRPTGAMQPPEPTVGGNAGSGASASHNGGGDVVPPSADIDQDLLTTPMDSPLVSWNKWGFQLQSFRVKSHPSHSFLVQTFYAICLNRPFFSCDQLKS